MLPYWLRAPNSYLRSETEDRVSALLVSVGFGLSVAGTIALAMRTCHDSIAQWSSVTYFSIITLTLALSITYYSGWGTWIRRRVRNVLRAMVALCCAMAWIPLLLTTGAHPLYSAVITLYNLGLVVWVVKKKFSMVDTSGTLWPALILFMALINSICAMVIHSDMSHLTLAIPSALLIIGGIPLITPYRPWSHAAWHVFTLAACVAYYIITWQRLT